MKILKEGDRSVAIAPGRGRVPVIYRYQDLRLDSGVTVKDVLVGVAEDTGEVLTIPAQSTPRIKLARTRPKEETFSVRIPREFDDLILLVALELHANPAKLGAAIIRFYLHTAAENPALAKRLKRLANTELAQRSSTSRLTLRSDFELLDRLTRVEETHDVSRSDLVRGALLAAKEDVLEKKPKRWLEQLQAIADAV